MTPAAQESIAVEFRSVTKRFGAFVANDGISIRVRRGSIHGIIGENGAGKSTAMKLLYGMYAPDEGRLLIDGVDRKWRSPRDAISAGIGMVHQHFMLAGPATALDNILLGAEGGTWRWLPGAFRPMRRGAARARLQALSQQYGLSVPWDEPVERLPVGVQQRIEILKLLYRDANVLILDEPTAVLTPQETLDLFVQLRKLRDEGKTILIITHKLKEVMALTDRVTVMRAGKVTGEVETAQTDPQALADLMVGRKVVLTVEATPAKPLESEAPALELESLSLAGEGTGSRPRIDSVSLRVRRGEVVGVAGVEGNGQSELLQAILHPRDANCRTSGEVKVLGQSVTRWATDRIKELGVGVIPEDRHLEGLLLERPLTENFLLGLQRSWRFSRGGLLGMREWELATRRAVEEYDVRPRDISALAGQLSGGNQQKLIVAREFERKPRFIIAAQPTRGVDVGAIEFIHKRILAARDAGAGVLLVSSELDEVLALSDRVLVLYEGRIAGEFTREKANEREIGLLMGGGAGRTAGPAEARQG